MIDPPTTIIQGDCREVLKTLPDKSVHCVVTSPPYWGLRDYGVENQLGLEPTPEEYVENLVAVFREVRRVLRDDGTVWLNLGDSYASSPASGGPGKQDGGEHQRTPRRGYVRPGQCKPKDLVGIPWMVAFALRADGWWLRSDIVWSKPNPMPESVRDRPTRAHEYVFLLSKSKTYYYDADAIREPLAEATIEDLARRKNPGEHNGLTKFGKGSGLGAGPRIARQDGSADLPGRNKRSVWEIATQPFPGAHFAVMSENLVKPCILAGTSERGSCPECGAPWARVTDRSTEPHPNRYSKTNDAKQFDASGNGYAEGGTLGVAQVVTTTGWNPTCKCMTADERTLVIPEPVPCTVLDPFAGAGTVGVVALKLCRASVLIELSEPYCEMIRERMGEFALPLFEALS